MVAGPRSELEKGKDGTGEEIRKQMETMKRRTKMMVATQEKEKRKRKENGFDREKKRRRKRKRKKRK